MAGRPSYLATALDTVTLPPHTQLIGLVVGTLAASSVITIYDGQSASGVVRAIIAGTTEKSVDLFGMRAGAGWHIVLSGGNAKVTVVSD